MKDARLCSLSVFDAFRLLQGVVNIPTQEREDYVFSAVCLPTTWSLALKRCHTLRLAITDPDYCFLFSGKR